MSADEHLSPTQFGFKQASYDDWDQALLSSRTHLGRKPVHLSADLHTAQDAIDPEAVRSYAAMGRIAGDHDISIHHMDGKMYVADGHHRIAAARQRGQKTITATHYGA
jgi:hypothetical protein